MPKKIRNFGLLRPQFPKTIVRCPKMSTGAAPTSFIITTYDLPATVTISEPANDISSFPATGFTPIVVNIPANSTQRVQLWSDNFNTIPAESQMRKNVQNRPDPNDPKKS